MGLKLRFFDINNRPDVGRGIRNKPTVSFSANGCISFNKAAKDYLSLKADMQVTFACDENNRKNWYVFLDPKAGLPLRAKGKTDTFQLNHAELTKSIRFNIPTEKKTLLFYIGEVIEDDGMRLFPLIPKLK